MINLKNLNFVELKNFIKKINEPNFRAQQILKWLSDGVENFYEMSNISEKTRKKLISSSYISKIDIKKKIVSEIDRTTKYLFKLDDLNYIESVLMKYKHGFTVCISTQVGCKMNCKFCASSKNGWFRNLTCSEMIDQILAISKDSKIKISNIVLMGIGEPLDNYENIIKFLSIINCVHGLNISYRRITISTCGLANKIIDLAEKKFQITLSVSLHATNDKIRNSIMPINLKYNLKTLINACKYYVANTKRRITFEYALIREINDKTEDANKLSELVRGILCHINLIEINPIHEINFDKPNSNSVTKFIQILRKNKINVTLRRKMGEEINASCGQLRNKIINEEY
ncbi:MAG: 23S rRNA (adenine(2503)-C(2))-methyltransferase RlmN [Clostridiales bacterium]|jgi:23S rRNA (adenine2503-C2)-methyltransferase|nr:23S rRNA (adenine(2503)-C(2))-methyltransferase RlmN [Clostridiales bacterium]